MFGERLCRSVKYEDVCIKACDSFGANRHNLANYIELSNALWLHRDHGARPPDMVYFSALPGLQGTA